MTEKNAIYSCPECGLVIEVLNPGAVPVCCGQAMTLKRENTSDGAAEKHVPLVEKCENGIKVTVGSVAHPMTAEHHIAWIEVFADGVLYRRELVPGAAPEAYFDVPYSDTLEVREYCNIHGLWRK